MREHHPMRYNRLTEVLKTVSSVKLSTAFLLKSYFLKRPLGGFKFKIDNDGKKSMLLISNYLKHLQTMLFSLYVFNIFAMGYVVFALERAYGTCMLYQDVVWLVAVTLTNLGYGEFTPRKVSSNNLLLFILILSHQVDWPGTFDMNHIIWFKCY